MLNVISFVATVEIFCSILQTSWSVCFPCHVLQTVFPKLYAVECIIFTFHFCILPLLSVEQFLSSCVYIFHHFRNKINH